MSQNPQTQTLFVLELAVQGNAPSLRAVGFDRERLKGLGNVIAGAAPESSGYTLTELHERDGLWLSEGMLGIVESAGASSP